jgi:hypothetical protein
MRSFSDIDNRLLLGDVGESLIVNNLDRWKEYRDCEELVDRHKGEPAYIFCPGPTMNWTNPKRFVNKVTIAVNSAGYAFDPTYWLFAEASYSRRAVKWVRTWNRQMKKTLSLLVTARSSAFLCQEESLRGEKFNEVYVLRWDEENILPPYCPGASIMNALITAWQMGCNPCYVIGLDLCKKGGAYIDGVPVTKEGKKSPFDRQLACLQKFSIPEFDVINGSPNSAEVLPFKYMSYEEINETVQGPV